MRGRAHKGLLLPTPSPSPSRLARFRRPHLFRSSDVLHMENSGVMSASYEANQSFPRLASNSNFRARNNNGQFSLGRSRKNKLRPTFSIMADSSVGSDLGLRLAADRMANDENSFDFSGCSEAAAANSLLVNTSRRSASFRRSSLSLWASAAPALNPNKAVLTLGSDSRVVMVNEMACQLFKCDGDELVGRTLDELVESERGLNALEEEDGLNAQSTVCGRVVDIRTGDGRVTSASLWKKEFPGGGGRSVAVMEQVEVANGNLTVGPGLSIAAMDERAKAIFQTEEEDDDDGHAPSNLAQLLPSVDASVVDDVVKTGRGRKLMTAGKTATGISFPAVAKVRAVEDGKADISVSVRRE